MCVTARKCGSLHNSRSTQQLLLQQQLLRAHRTFHMAMSKFQKPLITN
jgi:hypothetical protein